MALDLTPFLFPEVGSRGRDGTAALFLYSRIK